MPVTQISRAEALALINEQNSNEIIQTAVESSAALGTFRTMRMSSKVTRMPVIDALPTARFLAGDADAKPTSNMRWDRKILEAEEMAVIVPIPEAVFDDSEFGIWEQVRPRIAEAFAIVLDAAVFFSIGKPGSWPVGLVPGALAAGNLVTPGAGDDAAEQINKLMEAVEGEGVNPARLYSDFRLRAPLRGLRGAPSGVPIYTTDIAAGGPVDRVYGVPVTYLDNGTWRPDTAKALIGDPSMAILGIRQDITYTILTEATLGTGADQVNLAERDMIALRAKMRCAFQVADPYRVMAAKRAYPFAVLAPETAGTATAQASRRSSRTAA